MSPKINKIMHIEKPTVLIDKIIYEGNLPVLLHLKDVGVLDIQAKLIGYKHERQLRMKLNE